METLSIQLSTALTIGLAMSQGWTATIEDQTQEMVGDNYPKIANPVTAVQFLEAFIPQFIEKTVLAAGRQQVIDNFDSINESVDAQVKNGAFDSMILAGDFAGINAAVKASL